VNTKSSPRPVTFIDISAVNANFCMKLYMTVKQSDIHFITSLVEIHRKMTKLCCFSYDNPHFSVCEHHADWMRTGSLRRLSGLQALQIWTHWTITSGVLCWKSTINSSRSIRQQYWWVESHLGKSFGKIYHENTSTRRWRSSPSAWLPTWLWLPMVVTPSICSNSVRLQVCILISSPNKLALFRATNRLPVKTTLGMPRNGVCLSLKA